LAAVPATRANKARTAAQQAECYRLRLTGMSIRDIAKVTNLSTGTVENRIKAEINATVQPLADELRAIEVARMDRWLEKLNEQIEDDECAPRTARNVEVAVKVAERRAKLLGIDAPQQIEATVTEVTQADLALRELLHEARARVATEEANLAGG
jgi:transposase